MSKRNVKLKITGQLAQRCQASLEALGRYPLGPVTTIAISRALSEVKVVAKATSKAIRPFIEKHAGAEAGGIGPDHPKWAAFTDDPEVDAILHTEEHEIELRSVIDIKSFPAWMLSPPDDLEDRRARIPAELLFPLLDVGIVGGDG